jgi:hypothetical protein
MSANATRHIPVRRLSGKSFSSKLSEDVWAVLISGLLIVTVVISALLAGDIKFPVPVYQWANTGDLFGKVLTGSNLLLLALFGLIFVSLSSIAIFLSGGNTKKYIAGFFMIYLLAIVSLIIGGNKTINYYGIEYVVFGLLIGLLLSNLTVLPAWLREAARSEFFIKTGLVILGTSILFTNIVQAGVLSILQALLVSIFLFPMLQKQ